MERRLEILIFATGFVLAALYMVSQVVKGVGLVSGIQVLAVASPFLLAAVASFQRYWVGVTLAMLTVGLALPLPVISRFGVGFLLGGLLTMFAIAQSAIQKTVHSSSYFGARLIYIAGGVTLLRILYDRPGSARFGESGGLGEAIIYITGFMGFWAFSRICCRTYDPKTLLQPLIFFSIISCIIHLVRIAPNGPTQMMYHLFHRPFWLASAVSIAVLYYWIEKKKFVAPMPVIHVLMIGGILGLSALSAHRSRPLFALGIVLSAAWIYGRFKRAAVMIAILAVLGIGGLHVLFPSGLPAQIKRSLSTVISVDQGDFRAVAQSEGVSYEVGWSSGFRAAMYKIAWKRIRENPLAGSGFKFSIQSIMDEMYALTSNSEFRGIGALALAGGYHNSILALAVFCGLPAAIMVSVGIILILRRFLIYARSLPVSGDKVVAASLVGFLAASGGQMLMNGTSLDLFTCFLILGTMTGILQNKEFYAASKTSEHLQAKTLFRQESDGRPRQTYLPV